MRRRRFVVLLVLSIAGWLMAAGPAVATVIPVGQAAPAGEQTACSANFDWVQPTVTGGTSYAVPVNGTITSWSTNALAGAGQSLTFKVYRPVSANTYMVVAHAGPSTLTASGGLNTFPVSIPVHAGDLVGLYTVTTASCAFTVTGDAINHLSGDLGDGSTGGPFTADTDHRLNVSATLAPVPDVTALSPTSGPTAGGTAVTITGQDFTGATAVTFGGAPAKSFTVNSDASVTAVSPAGTTGSVDVAVTTAGGQSQQSAADKFVYLAPPTVTSVSPSQGPRSGGTSVTITGHGFTGATAVSFGAAEALFRVNSDSRITAVSPAGTTGAVDVRVTTAGGQSPASAADRFVYLAPPTVTSVSPSRGPRTGGTSVTITGHGFTGATAVSFGAAKARRFRVNSDSRITAVSPVSRTGTVHVRVSTRGGSDALSTHDKFTFVRVCVVPRLVGKKLNAAKRALKIAGCGLGNVTGSRTGKVNHQSRKPRTTLRAGTKVNIKLN